MTISVQVWVPVPVIETQQREFTLVSVPARSLMSRKMIGSALDQPASGAPLGSRSLFEGWYEDFLSNPRTEVETYCSSITSKGIERLGLQPAAKFPGMLVHGIHMALCVQKAGRCLLVRPRRVSLNI
jgi:hypothetical protein